MTKKRRIAIALDIAWALPQHHDVFAGTQRYAREQSNWECVVDEFPGETSATGRRQLRYDGIIARATSELARQAARKRIPLVNVWYNSPAKNAVTVHVDYNAVARLAADHFLERGFRRFGCCAAEGHAHTEFTARTFQQAVEERGHPCSNILLRTWHEGEQDSVAAQWSRWHASLAEWLSSLQTPVALLASHCYTARMIANLCQLRGLKIPQDVALLGLTDVKVIAEDPAPSISGIDLGFDTVGYEAAKLLDAMMDGHKPAKKLLLTPPKGIMARASTDYFAVDDQMIANALKYISANIAAPLTVKEIARQLAVAPRTLQKRFEEVLQSSLSAEILRLRVARAQRLLADPGRSVTQVALEAGFGTANQMYVVFQRQLGLSPSQYRKSVMDRR